jgi:hypothetical protein
MQTNEDIWLPERDAWGADRLAWEDEQEEPQPEEAQEPALEDPRY